MTPKNMACHDDIEAQTQSGVGVWGALEGDSPQAASQSFTFPLNDKGAK